MRVSPRTASNDRAGGMAFTKVRERAKSKSDRTVHSATCIPPERLDVVGATAKALTPITSAMKEVGTTVSKAQRARPTRSQIKVGPDIDNQT